MVAEKQHFVLKLNQLSNFELIHYAVCIKVHKIAAITFMAKLFLMHIH